jgi:hypothetical protein
VRASCFDKVIIGSSGKLARFKRLHLPNPLVQLHLFLLFSRRLTKLPPLLSSSVSGPVLLPCSPEELSRRALQVVCGLGLGGGPRDMASSVNEENRAAAQHREEVLILFFSIWFVLRLILQFYYSTFQKDPTCLFVSSERNINLLFCTTNEQTRGEPGFGVVRSFGLNPNTGRRSKKPNRMPICSCFCCFHEGEGRVI